MYGLNVCQPSKNKTQTKQKQILMKFCFIRKFYFEVSFLLMAIISTQVSYASGKCEGNLKIFKVRELSGNFVLSGKNECFLKCQGNVREF